MADATIKSFLRSESCKAYVNYKLGRKQETTCLMKALIVDYQESRGVDLHKHSDHLWTDPLVELDLDDSGIWPTSQGHCRMNSIMLPLTSTNTVESQDLCPKRTALPRTVC